MKAPQEVTNISHQILDILVKNELQSAEAVACLLSLTVDIVSRSSRTEEDFKHNLSVVANSLHQVMREAKGMFAKAEE
jgi:hypothetical protein